MLAYSTSANKKSMAAQESLYRHLLCVFTVESYVLKSVNKIKPQSPNQNIEYIPMEHLIIAPLSGSNEY